MEDIYIGTAGWSIPKITNEFFFAEGTHLERYSQVLNGVEINSSFYRDHQPKTYRKWAECVPDNFRFAVKLSRYFTQEKKMKETHRLEEVLGGISELGSKWGVLLIQLPPSLIFNEFDADSFFSEVRRFCPQPIVFEPRNLTWATNTAIRLLENYGVNKVLADPEPCPFSSADNAKLNHLVYYRLHGSPEIYQSKYSADYVSNVANSLKRAAAQGKQAWCIFDNTTFGFATENALEAKAFTITDYAKNYTQDRVRNVERD